jgi:hypothetical protein
VEAASWFSAAASFTDENGVGRLELELLKPRATSLSFVAVWTPLPFAEPEKRIEWKDDKQENFSACDRRHFPICGSSLVSANPQVPGQLQRPCRTVFTRSRWQRK